MPTASATDPVNSSRLREQLFAAIERGDDALIARLCTQQAESITEYFAEWCEPPPEVSTDPDAARRWQDNLELIAALFASAGIPGLQDHLHGSPEERALIGPTFRFAQARELSEAGRYEESIRMVADLFNELPDETTPLQREFLSHVHGLLANDFFRLHDPASARSYAQRAQQLCAATGDADGMRVYAENLAAVDRLDPDGTIARCRSAIQQAQELTDRMRYDTSNAILVKVLSDVGERREVDRYRAKVLGLMGFNHYWLGDLARARTFTEAARQRCQDASDEPGQAIYRENLRVIDEAASRTSAASAT